MSARGFLHNPCFDVVHGHCTRKEDIVMFDISMHDSTLVHICDAAKQVKNYPLNEMKREGGCPRLCECFHVAPIYRYYKAKKHMCEPVEPFPRVVNSFRSCMQWGEMGSCETSRRASASQVTAFTTTNLLSLLKRSVSSPLLTSGTTVYNTLTRYRERAKCMSASPSLVSECSYTDHCLHQSDHRTQIASSRSHSRQACQAPLKRTLGQGLVCPLGRARSVNSWA